MMPRSDYFNSLLERAGIAKRDSQGRVVDFHSLRHTFCTNLLHHGADITHIKDLAGHQDIQTTARYYLGKDNAVLRKIVDRCLDYRSSEPQPRHSLDAELGPQANLHRESFEQQLTP